MLEIISSTSTNYKALRRSGSNQTPSWALRNWQKNEVNGVRSKQKKSNTQIIQTKKKEYEEMQTQIGLNYRNTGTIPTIIQIKRQKMALKWNPSCHRLQ